jgi:hypothetical protein
MIRYALHPGYMYSRYDGDRHFITSEQLMYLYRLKFDECLTIGADWDKGSRYYRGHDLWKLAHVYPRYNGDYEEARERLIARRKELDEKSDQNP